MRSFTVSADSMEMSISGEATNCSVTQEYPKILWNPKVRYGDHKSPPKVLNLSHVNPGHITPSYFSLRSTLIFGCIHPLLGNDSVNIFPRKRTRAIGRPLLGNGSVNKRSQQ
jgi:hypothetical protein